MLPLKNLGNPMSEPASHYFSYLERDNPEAILTLTRGVRKQIQRILERSPLIDAKEVTGLLERCDAVLTLLEYEVWVNCDDGK
jgi:cell division protein ZapA (FtsZ GTPase activity inhibitor)